MYLGEIKIVNMVCINGQWMRQEEVEPELFRRLLAEKVDFAMRNAGFIRKSAT